MSIEVDRGNNQVPYKTQSLTYRLAKIAYQSDRTCQALVQIRIEAPRIFTPLQYLRKIKEN